MIGLVVETHCNYFAPARLSAAGRGGAARRSIGRSSVRYGRHCSLADEAQCRRLRHFLQYMWPATRRPAATCPRRFIGCCRACSNHLAQPSVRCSSRHETLASSVPVLREFSGPERADAVTAACWVAHAAAREPGCTAAWRRPALQRLAGGAAAGGCQRGAGSTAPALSALWGVPFAGVLLSIAILPLLAPHFWHHHYGKVVAGLGARVPAAVRRCIRLRPAVDGFLHALVAEYIPFILLVGSLYVIAGGIFLRGNLHGSPALNTGLLAVGAVLASIMGTTGASMLLIRPLIRANDNRTSIAHVVVFFIFIGLERRRLADAARRSAAVPRLPEGRRFLLDDAAHLSGNAVPRRRAAGDLLFRSTRWHYRREGVMRPDPTPDSPTHRLRGPDQLPAARPAWSGWCC